MKRKILITLLFVVAVAVCVLAVSFFLNWRHQKNQSLNEEVNNNYQMKPKEGVDYQSFMDKNPTHQEIDKYLKKKGFNGDIAIYHNHELVMDQSYGYQDFENKKKVTPNTMYLIGSAQKFMTGLMLNKLESEGKVNINDPVSKYLPWFKTDKPILLRDLMLHQSGLKKFNGSPNAHSIQDVAKELQSAGIQKGMYRIHQYNDGNYIVLACVIEAVTKQSYAEYFYNNIAKPYDLQRTAFYDNGLYAPYMAKGYDNLKAYQKPKFMSQYYGAGNLYMSPRDMAKLLSDFQENKILSPKVTHDLLYEVKTKKFPSPYRYGFYSYDGGNRINGNFFGHQMTGYFNKNYIVVMGTNYQNPVGHNEKMLFDIFVHKLHQPVPTKMNKRMQQQTKKGLEKQAPFN